MSTPTPTPAPAPATDPEPETETIEHVVMFNVADDQDPVKVNAWMAGLTSLAALPDVLYLTAGPILRPRAFPHALHFTHLLHARYSSLTRLQSYSSDPAHVRVVTELGLPITSDIIALDWAWPARPGPPHPGRAVRFTFLRLADPAKIPDTLDGLARVKETCAGTFEDMTFGAEVSETRAKGFSVAAAAVFRDLNELDACEEYEDSVRSLFDKLKANLDGVISVDYVVPRCGPNTTSADV